VAPSKKLFAFSDGVISTAGKAYFIVLFLAGFLTNFFPIFPTNTGTILLFSLACLLSSIGMLYLLNPLQKHIAVAGYSTVVISALVVAKTFFDTNPISQRGQELVIFFLGAWPFLFFMQMNDRRIREQLLNTLAIGLFGLCAFGIFQGILLSSLPLNLFVLRGDPVFSIGSEQLRPTGLTGNPIIFSSILVFASAVFAALWLERRRVRFLLALICSLIANYLTYTRASFFLALPVLALVWLLHNRFRIKHKILVLAALLVSVAVVQYLVLNGTNLLIVQRLLGSSPESLESTLGHFKQVQDASDAIVAQPWTGTGMGSQGDFLGPGNVIITDGAWLTLLLEFGVPLTILIVTLLGLVLVPITKYVLRQESSNRTLAIATLSFHAYLFPASFINSAILSHISFGLYWAVLGLSLAAVGRDQGMSSAPRRAPVTGLSNYDSSVNSPSGREHLAHHRSRL
jgi:hypothetical protein